MADTYGRGGSYGTDWALGATLGAQGIIFVGDIPADLSQPYTPPPGWEWGFGIVPAPDPSTYVTPHPVADVGMPDLGGPLGPPPVSPFPETPPDSGPERTYPDTPPPAYKDVAPVTPGTDDWYENPPPPDTNIGPRDPWGGSQRGNPLDPGISVQPPYDSRAFGPSTIAWVTKGRRAPPKLPPITPAPPGQPPATGPEWEKVGGPEPIKLPPKPKIWEWEEEWPVPWAREFPRPRPRIPLPRVPGPVGVILDTIMRPEVLGSGDLPFPPIPPVTMPELPPITLPEPTSFPIPDPAIPEFNRPAVPDVVTVTPEDSWPLPSQSPAPIATPTSASPSVAQAPIPWWALLSALIGASARRSRKPSPRAQPRNFADPLTPPPGEFFPGTTPQPLTPVQGDTLTSGPPAQLPPQQLTQEDQCNCQSRGKQRKKPRKCLTRAPLIWAGGPKKGKAAGTRCVKFEDYL